MNKLHSLCALAVVGLLATAAGASEFILLHQKNGPATSDLLGASVAAAGDVDGDGVADFIVGAPWTGSYPGYTGSAFVYSGATGALLYQKDGTVGDELGWAVAGAGDVNGDGRADFIVGAPFAW